MSIQDAAAHATYHHHTQSFFFFFLLWQIQCISLRSSQAFLHLNQWICNTSWKVYILDHLYKLKSCQYQISYLNMSYYASKLQDGGVAQMVERSLSMREVPGSIPGASNLFYYCCVFEQFNHKNLHRPGIEPGPPAWQASILPLNQRCFIKKVINIYF